MAEAILAQEDRLDVLVNNAGVMTAERQESRDGHELTFQVNYLAHYLLTRRLLPLLERSAPARIVNVSSAGQRPIDFDDAMMLHDWDRARSYCRSKLAQILMTVDMAPDLAPRGIAINAVHPATFMPTNMVVGRFPPASSVDDGVESLMHLVADPALDGTTGRYFNRLQEARPDAQAEDAGARAKLRALSETLAGA
jgi:NAD(P)-dependent dehydrogenase (short-subunit alcohol dehydrogenase family)